MSESLTPAVIVSLISATIASISLIFSVLSWRQSNRPIVIARVSTANGGNSGIALDIVIENTGNRPARDIQLFSSKKHLKAALSNKEDEIPSDAERCFFGNIKIPVLANGCSVSNSFGHLGSQRGSWVAGTELPIKIKYRGLGLRKFQSKLNLLLADDEGFAQTFWKESKNRNG